MNVDKTFRMIFSHRYMVQELLCTFLPDAWVRELDYTTLEPISGMLPTEALGHREGDLIFKCRWRGNPLYLALLLEIQAQPQEHMALRTTVYVGLLLQHLVRHEGLKEGFLPPVRCVVLFTGQGAWDSAVDLADCMANDPFADRPNAHWRGCPWSSFSLIDRRVLTPERLAVMENLITRVLAVQTVDSLEVGIGWVRAYFMPWFREPGQGVLKRTIGLWLAERFRHKRARVLGDDEAKRLPLDEVRLMVAEMVTQWEEDLHRVEERAKQEGEQRGLQKGLREAEEREARAYREAVQALLEAKFGPIGLRFWQDFLEPCRMAAWRDVLEAVKKARHVDELGSLKKLAKA